jgi:hypothetical protein
VIARACACAAAATVVVLWRSRWPLAIFASEFVVGVAEVLEARRLRGALRAEVAEINADIERVALDPETWR